MSQDGRTHLAGTGTPQAGKPRAQSLLAVLGTHPAWLQVPGSYEALAVKSFGEGCSPVSAAAVTESRLHAEACIEAGRGVQGLNAAGFSRLLVRAQLHWPLQHGGCGRLVVTLLQGRQTMRWMGRDLLCGAHVVHEQTHR